MVALRRSVLRHGGLLTRHGENCFRTGCVFYLGLVDSPNSNGAALLRRAVHRLGSSTALIYPTVFSLKRTGGIIVIDAARKSSGPLGCPRVFLRTSVYIVGGVSLTPCLSASIRALQGGTLGMGRRLRLFRISTAGNAKVST